MVAVKHRTIRVMTYPLEESMLLAVPDDCAVEPLFVQALAGAAPLRRNVADPLSVVDDMFEPKNTRGGRLVVVWRVLEPVPGGFK